MLLTLQAFDDMPIRDVKVTGIGLAKLSFAEMKHVTAGMVQRTEYVSDAGGPISDQPRDRLPTAATSFRPSTCRQRRRP